MKCVKMLSEGVQCGAQALAGANLCFSHNPSTRSAKAAAVRKGGRAPKRVERALEPLPIGSPQEVLLLIVDTINRVRTEPFTHQKANCIGYLANIALKTFEVGEFSERLLRMEERVLDSR